MMNEPTRNPVPMKDATVELTVNGRRLRLRFGVPDATVAPRSILPLYRAIASTLTKLAVTEIEKKGYKITCKKGCGACCRQLVPISSVEAKEIAKVIERMPEPRRSEIRARFAAALKPLEDVGLLDRLRDPQAFAAEKMQNIHIDYFAMKIPCPFLEDESCSIYEDRPITCREYLVVSPVEYCGEPTPETVRAIKPLAGPIAMSIPPEDQNARGEPVKWVPLILAPEFAANHPEDPPRRQASELLEEFVNRINRPSQAANL